MLDHATKLLAVLCTAFPLLAGAAMRPGEPALTGEQIESRQDKMQSGYVGETRDMTLTLVNAQGQESVRKLRFEGFEGTTRHDKTVLRFDYPADLKGTALLTHEQADQDDDQWLFLPTIKRVKRIASSNKSGSFMGSEFAYEDLVVRQLDKYSFKYLGDETIDGKDCYVIEAVPRSEKSGYSRLMRWRQKSNLQEVRTDFFDRKGELLKQRALEDLRQFDGFWRATRITVSNVQTGKKSSLVFENLKLKQHLPEQAFSVQEFNAVE